MKNHGTVLSLERGWLISLTSLWKGGELFMPYLVFLHGCEDVDRSSLESYLKEWEWDGVNSPIEFLILCNWYKMIFDNENIL